MVAPIPKTTAPTSKVPLTSTVPASMADPTANHTKGTATRPAAAEAARRLMNRRGRR